MSRSSLARLELPRKPNAPGCTAQLLMPKSIEAMHGLRSILLKSESSGLEVWWRRCTPNAQSTSPPARCQPDEPENTRSATNSVEVSRVYIFGKNQLIRFGSSFEPRFGLKFGLTFP